MLIFNTVQSYRHKEMNFSQSHREARWQASGCFLKAFSGTRQTCAIVSARKHCPCVAGRQRNRLTICLVHTKLSSSSRLVQTVSYCPIYGKCTYRESHVLYTTPLLLPLPPHDFASLLTENTAASGFTAKPACLQILTHSSPPCQRGGQETRRSYWIHKAEQGTQRRCLKKAWVTRNKTPWLLSSF